MCQLVFILLKYRARSPADFVHSAGTVGLAGRV